MISKTDKDDKNLSYGYFNESTQGENSISVFEIVIQNMSCDTNFEDQLLNINWGLKQHLHGSP